MSDRSSVALRILGPRATLQGAIENSLEGVNTETLPDGALCYVSAEAKRYGLHRSSVVSPNPPDVIAPIAGPGRWIVEAGGSISIPFPVGDIDATGIPDGYVVSASGDVAIWGPVPTAFDVTSFQLVGGITLVEAGTTVTNPAFTATYNQTPTAATLTDSLSHSTDVTGTPTSFSSPFSDTLSTFGATWSFTLTASDSLGSDSASTSIVAGQNVYYGARASAAINEAFIKSLTPSLRTSASGSYGITALAGQTDYFCALTALGLTVSSFTVGGFPFACSKVGSAVNVTNAHGVTAAYDVFGSTNMGLAPLTLVVS